MDEQVKEQLEIYKNKLLNLLEALAYAILFHFDKPVNLMFGWHTKLCYKESCNVY